MSRRQPEYTMTRFDFRKKNDLEMLSSLAGDDARTNLSVGEAYYRKGMYRQALPHLECAADGGSADAMVYLARMRYHGRGIPVDVPGAIEVSRKAAGLGDPRAMCALGIIRLAGASSESDEREAYQLFSRAAAKGDPQAINALAMFHMAGRCVERDLDEAERLLRRAFSLGDRRSVANLGMLQDIREGVEYGWDDLTGRMGSAYE